MTKPRLLILRVFVLLLSLSFAIVSEFVYPIPEFHKRDPLPNHDPSRNIPPALHSSQIETTRVIILVVFAIALACYYNWLVSTTNPLASKRPFLSLKDAFAFGLIDLALIIVLVFWYVTRYYILSFR